MAWLASYKSMTLTLKWALVLLGGPTIVTSLVHLVFHTLDYFTEFFPIPSALSLLPPSCSTGKGKQLEEDIASPLWPEFALDHASVGGPSSTYRLDLTASSAKAKTVF